MSSSSKKPSVDSQIDNNLRKIFEEDVEQDLPERLRRLVERLDTPDEAEDDDDASESRDGEPDAHKKTSAVAHRTDAVVRSRRDEGGDRRRSASAMRSRPR